MKPPYFWQAGLEPKSREAAPLTRALLTPLAMCYAFIVQQKISSTRPFEANIPVICIGNLTLGGAGKSPVVAALRSYISAKGVRVASLSRGYGGKLKGPLKIAPDTHTAREVGDEPLMLAIGGESWIGTDRPAAARAMTDDDVQLIIMDDGHQNPSLGKDLSLVVIDAAAPFGNGFVTPKGPLREPVGRGLQRADAIILMGDGPVPEAVTSSGLPVFRARIEPVGPPPPGRLVAFAGIGRPEKFFDSLRKAGGDVVEDVPFPDHHPYSASDMAYLSQLAEDRGARLISTAKDHARLAPAAGKHIAVFPVRAVFENIAALDDLLAPHV